MSSIPLRPLTDDLTSALVETGATIAFDAIGGGKLAGQILVAMESAQQDRQGLQPLRLQRAQAGLCLWQPRHPRDRAARGVGMAWGIGGWLLFPFLMKIGPEAGNKLRRAWWRS